MKRRIIILATITGIIVLYIIRVVIVNQNTFHVAKEKYAKGEVCTYEEFQYRVLSSVVMDKNAIEEKFGNTYEEYMPVTTDYIVTEMEVTYIGSEQEAKCKGLFEFTSGGWSNGNAMYLMNQLNKDDMVVRNGETRTMWIFGSMSEPQFTAKEWKNRHDMKFQLVLSILPKEVIMECQ